MRSSSVKGCLSLLEILLFIKYFRHECVITNAAAYFKLFFVYSLFRTISALF